MISRERILYAAARVYAQHGFRGATTRLIAQEAGVNEVTLFRIFGSKSALLKEVVEQSSINTLCPDLPTDPVDPEKEVTAWVQAYFGGLTARRSLVRTTMGEIEERPDVGFCIAQGPIAANNALREYVRRLQKAGIADATIDPIAPCAMLMGALFGDAMGRDMMPQMFPPEGQAAAQYTRSFLRSLGVATAGARSPRARAGRTTRTRSAS